MDDEVFEHTIATFPEFNAEGHEKLVRLDEDWLKSDEGKTKWRDFINQCVRLVIFFPPSGATYTMYRGVTCGWTLTVDGSVADMKPK